jgi:putative hydrolase of HD superfamily
VHLQDLIQFSELLTKLQQTERVIRVCASDRFENDVEHSYMLALLGWYFIEKGKLKLDSNKVVKYALVHDLVEAYAGDVYLYEADAEIRKNKHKKEQEAAARIKKEFPDFLELHALIESYESRADDESKFVYALDKVQPVIQIYLDKGRTWNERKITLTMLIEAKVDKVALSEPVKKIFDELVAFLRTHEKELFMR